MNLESLSDMQFVMIAVLSLIFLVIISTVIIKALVKSRRKFDDLPKSTPKVIENLPPESDPEFIIYQIKERIGQIDLSLMVNETEYSNKLYLEARKLYYNPILTLEYQSKVKDDLLRIHNALYKKNDLQFPNPK